MRYREPAICLRATDFSETSQVVHFLTRGQGVVRLLAKGTKRPKSKSGGMIDLLSEGELIYSHSGRDTLGTLIEFSESVVHSDLRKERRRLNIGLYALEAAGEMLAEGDVHAEVFDLLHNTLIRLGQADAPVWAVLAYFQWRLLLHVGLLGDLTNCVGCGEALVGRGMGVPPMRPEGVSPSVRDDKDHGQDAHETHGQDAHATVYFSSRQGGLLCQSCQASAPEKFPVDADTLAGLSILLAVTAGRRQALDEPQARAVNRMLAYHLQQQLGKRLRMGRYVG